MSGIKTFGADTDLFSTDVIVESGVQVVLS